MALVIDMVRALITPDVVRGASRTIGEDPSAVQNTLNGAVPSLLAGALHQGATPAGAEKLRSLVTQGGFGTDPTSTVNRMLESPTGADSPVRAGENVVSQLFGGKADRVTDILARTGGVQRNAAGTLLSMAAPLVMSVLGKQIASRNLDAGGLMRMLSGERDSIIRAMPAGLGRELGLDETGTERTRTHVQEPVHSTTHREHGRPPQRKRSSAKPLLIGGLAALALLFFLTRNRDRRDEVIVDVPPAAERPTTPPAAPPMVTPAPQVQPMQPEAGTMAEPAAPISGLARYLTDGTGATPRHFVIEGVTFANNSSQLSADARNKVRSVAEVLAAHPNIQIRIEGHTDSQGDAEANRRLSKERAEAVKQALVARGVPAGQISTEGVGGDRPVASNDSDDGRTQNRRIELVVIQR